MKLKLSPQNIGQHLQSIYSINIFQFRKITVVCLEDFKLFHKLSLKFKLSHKRIQPHVAKAKWKTNLYTYPTPKSISICFIYFEL